MTGLTNYITQCRWSDIFHTWFMLIDDAYHSVCETLPSPLRQRGPQPLLHDSEVITIALIIETFFGGNEQLGLSFVRQYHLDMFPRLLEASRFNRRRRHLVMVIEAVRRQLTTQLISSQEQVRLVDSAPIPVCTYMRSNQCQSVSGKEYCGVMASRRAKLYGVRVHLTTTTEQVVDKWMIAPAALSDSKMAVALLEADQDIWVLGDNAYHAPHCIELVKDLRNITLVGMPKRNPGNSRYGTKVKSKPRAKEKWSAGWSLEMRQRLNRVRRRIESALSVLCTVFHLERLGSRSFWGIFARTASRLLAYNLSFLASPILSPAPSPKSTKLAFSV